MSTCIDPLPDFTNFLYLIVSPPDGPKGQGWDKLKECERRLTLYRWAERLNAPPKGTHILGRPPNKVFLDDCLSAFLLTLEAALQFTGDQLEKGKKIPKKYDNKGKKCVEIRFGEWLRNRPEHDCRMRGLRTLRHFAAHKEIKPMRVGVTFIAPARSMAVIAGHPGLPKLPDTGGGIAHRWGLPELTRADLEKLNTPELNLKAIRAMKKAKAAKIIRKPIALKDLRAWNKIVFLYEAGTILEHGLRPCVST